MYDITVYAAVIVAILLRVYLMKGSFTLPTFYKVGNDVSFNLGSLTSVVRCRFNCIFCTTNR